MGGANRSQVAAGTTVRSTGRSQESGQLRGGFELGIGSRINKSCLVA
jgi:hypothetical protein